jgi:hypothetical protein
MTTSAQLARLQKRAIENSAEEPAFFKALLTADLYAHLPLSDDSGKVRLICFTRPDGLTVIPAFTDAAKAHAASGGAVKVVCVKGRDLFASAPGATWMLDPNDVGCTLYPEEIGALLRDDCMPIVQEHAAGDPVVVSPARPEDAWLGRAAVQAVVPIASVSAVYLVEITREKPACTNSLLVVLAVHDAHVEHAVRAVGVALVACPQTPRVPVDVTICAPGQPPGWLSEAGLPPLWKRSSAEPTANRPD